MYSSSYLSLFLQDLRESEEDEAAMESPVRTLVCGCRTSEHHAVLSLVEKDIVYPLKAKLGS